MTGSYHNLFRVFDRPSNTDIVLEASRDQITGPVHALPAVQVLTGTERKEYAEQLHADDLDFGAKIMHADWHPSRGIVALAAVNNLYIFRQ
jgi:hypothetical protein